MADPSVGVAVCVWRDRSRKQVLVGSRLGGTSRDTVLAFPGGHWEPDETLVEAGRREVREEAGIEIADVTFVGIHEFRRIEKNATYLSVWFEAYLQPPLNGDVSNGWSVEEKAWRWVQISELDSSALWKLDHEFLHRILTKTYYGYPDTLAEI